MELAGKIPPRHVWTTVLESAMPSQKCTDTTKQALSPPACLGKQVQLPSCLVHPTQYMHLTKIITMVFLCLPLRVFMTGI